MTSGNPINVATGAGVGLAGLGAGAAMIRSGRGMASNAKYMGEASNYLKESGRFASAAMRRYGSAGALGLGAIGFTMSGIRDIKQGEYNNMKGKAGAAGALALTAGIAMKSGRSMSENAQELRRAASKMVRARNFRSLSFGAYGAAAVTGAQAVRKVGQGEYKKGAIYGGATAGIIGGAALLNRKSLSFASEARKISEQVGRLGRFSPGKSVAMGLGIAAGAAAGGYAMYKHGTSVFAGSGG